MIERIEYGVTEQGIKVTLPQEMGRRLLRPNDSGQYSDIVRAASVPRAVKVVEMYPSDEGYAVDLNFEKVLDLKSKIDKGNALRQLSKAHKQIVETASDGQRNEAVEISYGERSRRSGLFSMSALLHWPDADIREKLDGQIQHDMRHAASFLLPMDEDDIAHNVRSQLSSHFSTARLIVDKENEVEMIARPSDEDSGEGARLVPLNVLTDAQQLVCLTGLASFAKHR